MNFKEINEQLNNLEEDLYRLQSGEGTIILKEKEKENILESQTNSRLELIETVKEYIRNTSIAIFDASKKENKYFPFCAFAVYKNTYKERLKITLEEDNNKIFTELDFVESEMQYLSDLKERFENYHYHNGLLHTFDKKIKFLETKKLELSTNDELIDFSDTTAIEKILFLHKLKVLDFLREQSPFNTSTNKLAQYLSAVTGEKIITLQPILNATFNETVSQKNSPFKTKKTVEKVENQLNKMGVTSKNTN